MLRYLTALLLIVLLAACQSDESTDQTKESMVAVPPDAMRLEQFRLANFADQSLQWELVASTAAMNRDQTQGTLEDVLITLQRKGVDNDAQIRAGHGVLFPSSERVELSDRVLIEIPADQVRVSSEAMHFLGKEKRALSDQPVQIQAAEIQMTGKRFEYLMLSGDLRLFGSVVATIPAHALTRQEATR